MSSCWATWLLQRDDRVARTCGLQLACRCSPSERGMELTGEWRRAENHRIRYTRQGRVRRLVEYVFETFPGKMV